MTDIFNAAFRQQQIHDPFRLKASQPDAMQGSRNLFPSLFRRLSWDFQDRRSATSR